jgi:hypothetical protein
MIKLEMRGRTHDEARVVSAQFKVEADYEQLRSALEKAMEAECEWAEANDVIIGHLKAYIKRGDDAVMLSTTGYGVQTKGAPGEGAELDVGIDSITYGSTLGVAEQRLEALARGLLAGNEIEVNWDCGDENCTDPSHHHHHHDHDHHHDHGEACSCGHDHEEHAHNAIRIPVRVVKKPVKVHPKMVYPGHED